MWIRSNWYINTQGYTCSLSTNHYPNSEHVTHQRRFQWILENSHSKTSSLKTWILTYTQKLKTCLKLVFFLQTGRVMHVVTVTGPLHSTRSHTRLPICLQEELQSRNKLNQNDQWYIVGIWKPKHHINSNSGPIGCIWHSSQKAMTNLIKICAIWKYLYITGMYYTCTNALLHPLQLCKCHPVWTTKIHSRKIPNHPEHVCQPILNRNKFSSSSMALKELHWLPIEQRIWYKILTSTFKCITGTALKY